ncbi:PAS domain-containing protein [Treponema sp. OttesenSCG-928-L16]|nr:PAS domain-containing protein [Treponema sp. OttesenSCG-928-L16]
MAKSKNALSRTDRLILDSYKNCVEAFAVYLGDAFEFVLHDLEDLDHSVIKIVNGHHSGRIEGAPITDLALSMLDRITKNGDERFIAYHAKSKYGKPVKALTLAIFGERDRVIGLLCVNFYLDTPLSALLENFLPQHQVEYISENFISDSDELIVKSLEKAKADVFPAGHIPPALKNKEVITLLYHQGIFKLKNAVALVSRDLGITRNTVYMHIRALEKK